MIVPTLLKPYDTLLVPPVVEPLDLEETKKQRRFTSTSMDTLFDLWISAARQYFEEESGRQLITATWESAYAAFPVEGVIEIPHPPLQSVLEVAVDDGAGGETIIDPASYTVLAPRGPHCRCGRIVFGSAGYPTVTWGTYAVRVRYLAGYGNTPGDVPELIRAALLYLVGNHHRFSEETQELKGNSTLAPVSHGAKDIMMAWKRTGLMTLKMTAGAPVWPV